MKLNRRRPGHPRLPIRVPATAGGADARADPVQGRTRNLSRGGLGLWLPGTLEPGAPVRVTLKVRGRAPLTLTGSVVWVRPHPDLPGWAVGIKFEADLPGDVVIEIADEEFPPWGGTRVPDPGTETKEGAGRRLAVSAGRPRAPSTEETMPERVLIVDDERSSRDFLEGILGGEGYELELFAAPAAAVARAIQAPPDLILLDILMPGMNGLEACQRLKQHPATEAVPVIVVTAVMEVTAKEEALTGGADDFVVKPVQPDDLRTRVKSMLRVRRIRQELDRTLAYLHELDAVRHTHRQAVLSEAGVIQERLPPAAIPVLLVDDEALTRDFYGDLLTTHGFEVFTAASGAEGLALAARESLEAVILDIMMPEMSGIEVLERLRTEQPELPVIMLTAAPTSQTAIAALKLGALDFIVKGLDHHLVILAVHRAVRHRREVQKAQEEVSALRAKLAELEGRADRAGGPTGP